MAFRLRQPLKKLFKESLIPRSVLPKRSIHFIPNWLGTRKTQVSNILNLANATRKNREKRRKNILAEVSAAKRTLNPLNVLSEQKQLLSRKATSGMKKNQEFVLASGKATPQQLRLLPIQAGALMHIPLQLMVLKRGYSPIEFLARQEMFADPNFQIYSIAKEIHFKNNTGGLYGNYTENWNNISRSVKTFLSKHKPREELGIITNYDHIVPRSDIAIKFIITIISSLKFDYVLLETMNQKDFDEYVKDLVAKEIPDLKDIETINTVYNSEENLRVLTNIEHLKYSHLSSHQINAATFLPETMYQRFNSLQGGLPREIVGYRNKISDNREYTKEEILSFMVKTNNTIADTLIKTGTPFVKKFAENMKNFFRERVGLPIQQGGSLESMDEYALYNYLVYTFGSRYDAKGEERLSNKKEEKVNEEIRNSLEKIVTNIFKHIIEQNKLYNTFTSK
jgi:hypothetical protein